MDFHILKKSFLPGCEKDIGRNIEGFYIRIFIPMSSKFISFFITHDHEILLTIKFDAMFQLNHFSNMFKQCIGKELFIFGNEISVIVFEIGRNLVGVLTTIHPFTSDNCFYSFISNICANIILVIRTKNELTI